MMEIPFLTHDTTTPRGLHQGSEAPLAATAATLPALEQEIAGAGV